MTDNLIQRPPNVSQPFLLLLSVRVWRHQHMLARCLCITYSMVLLPMVVTGARPEIDVFAVENDARVQIGYS